MNASELEREFLYRKLLAQNSELRSQLNSTNFTLKYLQKNHEKMVEKEVDRRTKEYQAKLKEKEKIILDKDKLLEDKENQINALKYELAHMASKMDNDSNNSGIPTSQTPYNKKKRIPNTRIKSNNSIGAQKNHDKHKLFAFDESEATEIIEIVPKKCPNCGSNNIVKTDSFKNKCETDYEVKLIKRIYKYEECICNDCNHVFHEMIPNNLKEENQYGSTVQSLSVCLTNEIYTPFNKTVKLIEGITDGNIKLSEGYVVKLQKKAYNLLQPFIREMEQHISNQAVYGWDEGIIYIDKKQSILRTYCADKVALFYASNSKSGDSVKEDNILPNTKRNTIVMHDHNLISYNSDYVFDNVECFIHLNRRLEKMHDKTNHQYLIKLKELLCKTNSDRNQLIKEDKDAFSKEYLSNLHNTYLSIIEEGKNINENETTIENPFKEEESTLLNDLIKYKDNYLRWADRFDIPSTNNDCERAIRPIKSKMKISGQFKNLNNASYYATIRSYIETCKRNGINIILACKELMSGHPLKLSDILQLQKND